MKMKVTIYTTLLAGIALVSSCKKEDNKNNGGGGTGIPASSEITAGQCSIAFNTDKDFNGTTTINISPSNTTVSVRSSSVNKDQLTLTAVSYKLEGTSAKTTTAQLAVYVPSGSTGNLSGSFGGNGDVVAQIMVSNLNAGQSTPAYASKSGSIAITKLTATEVEGSFNASCVNESENTSIELTNGKFAAKFK